MSEDLKSLMAEVRVDLSDDFIAMHVVGQDGISIAGEAVQSDFNDQLAAAHFAMVMKLAGRLSSELDMGRVIENQFTTDALVALSRTLGDGSFYWLLVAKAQANIGLLRAVMMVGKPVLFNVPKSKKEPGKTAMVVGNLSVADDRGLQMVSDVFLELHAGEILGLAGVQGNGQTELIEALAGLRPQLTGHTLLFGQHVENPNPRLLAELGVAYIPADRQKTGLVLPFSVSDNLALKSYYKQPFAKGVTLQETVFDSNASHLVMSYGIQAADIHSQVVTLSGGNQQKVILAREISKPIKLLIADQPTRGLDVGSIELVHRYLVDKRDHGCAILLTSTDLDEILSISDRIAVMFRGRIVGQLPAAKASKSVVGMMMAGIPAPTAVTNGRG